MKAILFSLFFIASLVIFLGCGLDDLENSVQLVVNGPENLAASSSPVNYTAKGFNGQLVDQYSTFVSEPVFWYKLLCLEGGKYKLVGEEVGGLTYTTSFPMAGTYVILVSPGATFKTGNIVNAELSTRARLTVTVSKGQGYKDSVISPRILVSEWYPGYISLSAARTTVEPKVDKPVSFEWFIDGINFGSGVEVGVAVSEGKHSIKLEVGTLYGYRAYREVDYTYKTGAPDVQIDGPSGGVSDGKSGVIDNNPYVPPPDDQGEGDRNAIFSLPVEVTAKLSSDNISEVVYIEGQATDVAVFIDYFDSTIIKFLSVVGLNGWTVDQSNVQQVGTSLSFTASNPSSSSGKKEAFKIIFQPLKLGIAGVSWPKNMVGCFAFLNDKEVIIQNGNSEDEPPRIIVKN